MKKVLSLLLSLLMLFSITAGIDFSAYALESSGKCGDNVTWSFDSATGTLTISGTGDMYDYDWEESPFYKSSIQSAVIENGITSIGNYAFYYCTSLTSVTIPNSVTIIGDWAFRYCSSLTSVTIPNSVTSIGYDAFGVCSSLTSVTIGNSVTSIGNGAFFRCSSLTSVTIPNSVTSIGNDAFYLVNNIVYNGTASGSPWGAKSVNGYVDGYLVYADSTKKELLGCSAQATNVTIPNSVTGIGSSAFRGCSSLTSVTIGNSVTSIGNEAFSHCTSLTSVTIPNSVTSIGYEAFFYCRSLTSVTIPNSVTSIGEDAFYRVNNIVYNGTASGSPWGAKAVNGYVDRYLVYRNSTKKELLGCFTQATNITIPNSVTSIGDVAFAECSSLTSVTIPDSVTSIRYSTFYNCSSLTSVTIPDSVTSIGDCAFSNCSSLTSVTIPNSVTSIGEEAFYKCSSLTSVTIGNSVTSIGDYAFHNCKSLTSVTIPNSVTSIGNGAFSWCTSLTSATIPNSVTSIGDYAFYRCKSLTDVYYTGSETQWNNISIGSYNNDLVDATIHYNYVPPCYHDIVIDKAVAPTCTKTGLTEGGHCTICGEVLKKQKVVAKKAHTYKNYVTKATLTANGKIVNKCSVCGVVKSTTAIPLVKTFTLSATNYTYDGKVKTPAVTVKDSKGKTLRKGTDYDVTYSSGRKNVGKYSVKITLKGNYYGTKTLYFNINPKGTTIAKLTPKSKSFTVQWNKQTNQTTGYQIQYSVYSNFKSAKTITMPKNTYYAKSITGLSGNKRYYVRIRTYKTVKFNGKNYNLYSPWSSTKYTTTKR